MSNTLFVIGNGFDLHHGIPSRYDDFREFLNKHDKDLLNSIKEYLPLYENELWCDFESALAHLNKDYVKDYASNVLMPYSSDEWSDSGHHDYQYEIGEIVHNLTDSLKQRFSEWIFQIDLNVYNRKLNYINPDSHYLTFNYTRTLQSLYAVPDENILHIHGKSKSPNSSLVLGHGDNPSKHERLNRYDDADRDTRILEGEQTIAEYFKLSYKPTNKIISDNEDFFTKLSQVNTVIVLGHSMSDVDICYFEKIIQSIQLENVCWYVSYYTNEERETICQQLRKIGVDERKVSLITLDESNQCSGISFNNQLSIF
jgi:hypothetical protein